MTKAHSPVSQATHYSSAECTSLIEALEKKYEYIDEKDEFASLVNFSTAKAEPYQHWVRYREGYSTILIDELLRRSQLNKEEFCVADPMVGSGSTVISAVRNGYSAFGLDVNPYCKLIIDAKLLHPTKADINAALNLASNIKTNCYVSNNDVPLQNYFPDENRTALFNIREQISGVDNYVAKKILEAAWFFILESCSNRKKDGNGLATRPAPVTDVYSFFKDTVSNIIKDYMDHPLPSEPRSEVYTGSAMEFTEYADNFKQLSGKKLGAIIFSPPYANSFDYFESYKLELLFGGFFTWEQFKEEKGKLIRNYRICYGKQLESEFPVVEALCKEINSAIPIKEKLLGKRDGRTRLMPNMLRGYFQDMDNVLKQLFAALNAGGRCYIVVDQSAYVGVIVPTDVILAHIAELHNFQVESISVCRRAATSGQQLKRYPYLKESLRESIITLRK